MPRFTFVSPETIKQATKHSGPKTDRAEQYELVRDALQTGFQSGQAVVFELDESDKPITVNNRIHRAAAELGYEIYARRSGNVVRVKQTGTVEPVMRNKPGRKASSKTASA